MNEKRIVRYKTGYIVFATIRRGEYVYLPRATYNPILALFDRRRKYLVYMIEEHEFAILSFTLGSFSCIRYPLFEMLDAYDTSGMLEKQGLIEDGYAIGKSVKMNNGQWIDWLLADGHLE